MKKLTLPLILVIAAVLITAVVIGVRATTTARRNQAPSNATSTATKAPEVAPEPAAAAPAESPAPESEASGAGETTEEAAGSDDETPAASGESTSEPTSRAQVPLPPALQIIGVDGSKANIPVNEILSGGPPPQGIPALGFGGNWQGTVSSSPTPSFVSQEDAGAWLGDAEPVIAVTVAGVTKAYPLQILMWHEIANDTIGDVPVAVTFCPLCNSALAFDRRVPLTEEAVQVLQAVNPDAELIDPDAALLEAYAQQEGDSEGIVSVLEVTFGVSGTLFNSNLLMFDSKASTIWSQILGQGNVGTLTDTKLLRLPAQIISFAEFREVFPDATVLSRETGFSRNYGRNPYIGYDNVDTSPFLFRGVTDGRLPPKARVVSVELSGDAAAYPFEVLQEARIVNDDLGGKPIAVFWQAGTASAIEGSTIATNQDVGSVGVFSRRLDGRELTFEWQGDAFVDRETGTTWDLLGRAVSGKLAGKQLTPVIHDNTLWFAWAAFKPETRIYTGSQSQL